VRVGDQVEVHLKNPAESSMIHSVDFHAATGPGGGFAVLQVNPGDEKVMAFKALVPGLYVYHCATPMVAEHIANGMYGMILVEPEDGLDKVDHELYLMQREIYTDAAFGQQGSQEVSVEKLLAETARVFRVQRFGRRADPAASAARQCRRDRAAVFRCQRADFTSSFHVIARSSTRSIPTAACSAPAARIANRQSGVGRRGDRGVQAGGPRQLHHPRPCDRARRTRARRHAGRRGNPNPEIYTPLPEPGPTGGH
jgi:hypothetical protein